MKKISKIGFGIVGAAAAGAAIIMVLAPKKGKKFRKNIAGSAKRLARVLNNLIVAGRDVYKEFEVSPGAKAQGLVADAREWVANKSISVNGEPGAEVKP